MYRVKIDGQVFAGLPKEDPNFEGVRLDDKSALSETMKETYTFANKQDYQYFLSKNYNHTFLFELEYSSDFGATFTLEATAKFTLKNCNIDRNKGLVKVSPLFESPYQPFIDQKDREFDLNDLGVDPRSVLYGESPVFQMYNRISNSIVNIGIGYFEEKNIGEKLTDLEANHWAWNQINGNNINGDFNGIIHVEAGFSASGTYRFLRFNLSGISNGNPDGAGNPYWEYVDPNTGERFTISQNNTFDMYYDDLVSPVFIGDGLGFISTASRAPITILAENARAIYFNPCFRLLTNKSLINNIDTLEFKGGGGIGRYTRVHSQYSIYNSIGISDELSDSNLGYGKVKSDANIDTTKFYAPPNTTENWIPIFQADWFNVSFWLKDNAAFENILNDGVTNKSVEAGYHVGLLLNAIVPRINPDYNHYITSGVFFNTNPMPLAQLSTPNQYPYIIPQSNLIKEVGISPNQKLTITFGQLMNELYGQYKVDYYLDNGELKLEHDQYFFAGKSYSIPTVGYNATTQTNARNNQPYAYATDNFDHDDKRTYKSLTIESESSGGSFEKCIIESVDNYTSNKHVNVPANMLINLTQQLIENNPQDKWFFAATVLGGQSGLTPSIPLVSIIHNNKTYRGYNGYCMPIWRALAWYMHQAPCVNVEINGVAQVTQSQTPIRWNEIVLPFEDFDKYELVTTLEGDGFIESYQVDRVNNNIKLKLSYGI